MSLLVLLLFLSPLITCRQYGVTFGAGEWSNPEFTYSSPEAFLSLQRLRATGATWVRFLMTWFQDGINTTHIYPIDPPSYLATVKDDHLVAITNEAHRLGMQVLFSPILDPNWDIPTNKRSGPGSVWRGIIGQSFNDTQWQQWFDSYKTFVLHYAVLAQQLKVEQFAIASELVVPFERTTQWRDIIKSIRAVYSGPLTVATQPQQTPEFWRDLDIIGIDAYYPLETVSDYPSVAELVKAWQPIIGKLEMYSKTYNKSILFTEVGYCSAYRSQAHPASMELIDPEDCSVWSLCVKLDVQKNLYEALFEALTPYTWWEGVFWWLWRTDLRDGGTSDPGFSPVGKPAEEVMKKWYSGNKTTGNK